MFPALRPVAQPSPARPLIPGWDAAATLLLAARLIPRAALLATVLSLLTGPWLVLAAEPSPVLIDPLDPRSEGEGPGLVGDPLVAALAVLLLGLLAAGLAAAYVRLVRPR